MNSYLTLDPHVRIDRNREGLLGSMDAQAQNAGCGGRGGCGDRRGRERRGAGAGRPADQRGQAGCPQGQVGGTAGEPIKAYLPQPGSGTLSFWLKTLGITAAGSCVSQAPEENEGTYPGFNSPNAIFIYSVADWIAQKYRSPLPGHEPTKAQNQFGTNVTGYLGLNKIDGISPVTTAKIPTINKAFSATHFTRTIYDIVRWVAAGDHIPATLNPILSRTGYFCHSTKATALIEDYGFLPALTCGSIS
jgi:hypothetical protein